MWKSFLAPLTGRASDTAARNAQFLRDLHLQMDAMVPEGSVVFLGDSLTYGLVTAALVPHCVKFATGGQRSDELLEEMRGLRCLSRASCVVITTGTNDILQGRAQGLGERYEQMLELVPGPVILCSVPPIQRPGFDQQARATSVVARAVCEDSRRCTFLDLHSALDGVIGALSADGVHLDVLGYEVWAQMLRQALTHARR